MGVLFRNFEHVSELAGFLRQLQVQAARIASEFHLGIGAQESHAAHSDVVVCAALREGFDIQLSVAGPHHGNGVQRVALRREPDIFA